MNEVVIIYHYRRSDYEWIIAYNKQHGFIREWHTNLQWEELEIQLNGVSIKQGGNEDGAYDMIDFKDGFLLACSKLLTFYSMKELYVGDL